VKIVVHEPDSDMARSLFETAGELVSASLGYVEARSALSRLAREGRMRGAVRDHARVALEQIWQKANIVDLDARLVGRAGDVSELLGLRASDAIHLTSALAVESPELVFATWDDELGRAARRAGLAVAP
jgi:hypothetical protein